MHHLSQPFRESWEIIFRRKKIKLNAKSCIFETAIIKNVSKILKVISTFK
jgi:hypothetical protein